MTQWFLHPLFPGHKDAWCTQKLGTGPLSVYVSYQEYYERLISLISRAKKKGDEILLIGWDIRVQATLRENDRLTLLQRLQQARRDGARVRLLATANNKDYSDNENQMKLAAAGDPKGRYKLEALFDKGLADGTTYHQKAAFFQLGSDRHLLLGGMDVTSNRIASWYDVQAEVTGRAAELGRITLEERWDSAAGRKQPDRSMVVESKDEARHQVQFVRSYAPAGKKPPASTRNFAAAGEHTYYMLLSHAIGAAKHFIYLEEQLLWSMGEAPKRSEKIYKFPPADRADIPGKPQLLEDLLVQAIQRGVKVVIVAANFDSVPRFKKPREPVARKLASARTIDKKNKPELLKTRAGMLFVHSKVWIFDDDFVVVGSANFWEQSMVSTRIPAESEFGVAFEPRVDGTALGFPKAKYGRALRLRLWERIRRTVDPKYVFPFKDKATFLEEIEELKKPIGGVSPFERMP